MTRRSPSTGLDYDTRTSVLIDRLGPDLTEQDFADLAVACADHAGLSIDEQVKLTEALNSRCVPARRLRAVTP